MELPDANLIRMSDDLLTLLFRVDQRVSGTHYLISQCCGVFMETGALSVAVATTHTVNMFY